MYLGPCQTSTMKLFLKIVKKWITIIAKTLYYRCFTGFKMRLCFPQVLIMKLLIFCCCMLYIPFLSKCQLNLLNLCFYSGALVLIYLCLSIDIDRIYFIYIYINFLEISKNLCDKNRRAHTVLARSKM